MGVIQLMQSEVILSLHDGDTVGIVTGHLNSLSYISFHQLYFLWRLLPIQHMCKERQLTTTCLQGNMWVLRDHRRALVDIFFPESNKVQVQISASVLSKWVNKSVAPSHSVAPLLQFQRHSLRESHSKHRDQQLKWNRRLRQIQWNLKISVWSQLRFIAVVALPCFSMKGEPWC